MRAKLIVLSLFAAVVLVTPVASQTEASRNTTDLKFLDMMMHHHTDGVKMADMGVDKAESEGVKALARRMEEGQKKDIDEMEKMRERHFSGQPKQMSMMTKRKEMTMAMMEKMAEQDMQKLRSASGLAFDRTFLDVFMKHHQMALDMSREEIAKGADAEVKRKAREIIDKQTMELTEMKRLKTQIASSR